MKTMKKHTGANVIAMEWGWDVNDLKDYRYQSTKTSVPVYAVDNAYYCATKEGEKPATHSGIEWDWKNTGSSFGHCVGWIIWEAKGDNKS